MGNDRRPPTTADLLDAAGMRVKLTDDRIAIDLRVDGAARLARALQRAHRDDPSDQAVSLLLDELMRVGRLARQRARRNRS